MFQATRRDEPCGGLPPWWVTAGVVAAVLLLAPVRLSAQAPPQAADPLQADAEELQRILHQMILMREQQIQQVLHMPMAPLPGAGRSVSPAWAAEAQLGIQVAAPGNTLVDQLDLPAGQGQVVTKVLPDDRAARAGVQLHDILLELDGKAVPSDPAAFARLAAEIKPNAPVNALVLRKGAQKKLTGLSLSEAPAAPPAAAGAAQFPQLPAMPGRGFGPRAPLGGGNLLPGFGALNPNVPATFTATSQQDGVTIDVEGTIDNGTVTATDVTVTDGDKPRHFASIDKVPEEYRDRVRTLINRATRGRAGAKAAIP
jgi:hypothetical protein